LEQQPILPIVPVSHLGHEENMIAAVSNLIQELSAHKHERVRKKPPEGGNF